MQCHMKKAGLELDSSFSITSKHSIERSTTFDSPTGHLCQQPKRNHATPPASKAPKRLMNTATATVSGVVECTGKWNKNNLSFTDRAVEKVSVHCDYNILQIYA